MTRTRIAASFLALLVALPSSAHAHMRWFLDNDATFDGHQFTLDLQSVLVLVGAGLFALFAVWIQRASRRWAVRQQLEEVTPDLEPWLWRLVAFMTGLSLIMNSAMRVYLAPNLVLEGAGVTWLGLILQLFLGVLLLTQVSFVVSAVLIGAALVLAFCSNPLLIVLDYFFEFAALGASFFLMGPRLSWLDRRVVEWMRLDLGPYRSLALPITRIGLGSSLVFLAIHNKWLNPSMAVAFLDAHDLNFMPYLGFTGFSHLHFAFAAGVAEATLGFLILFGVATRWNVGILSLFFFATLIVLGPVELVGHFPLLGIAALLIVCGGGRLVGSTRR